MISLTTTLCERFHLDRQMLMAFATSAPYRYKVYKIPKRHGNGTRTIAHPSKELKFFQRVLTEILTPLLPTSEVAFAYTHGKNIKKNAAQHATSVYLLKMDLSDFFPSISPDIFFSEAAKANIQFEPDDHRLLTLLLFRKTIQSHRLSLSIGAPSSPLISNFIMLNFDKALGDFCSSKGIAYSRYADDLTFSTKTRDLLQVIPVKVNSLLFEIFGSAIKVNPEKTVFSSKKHNRHVTGITLTNENSLSIGRDRKRLISAMIHRNIHIPLSDRDLDRLRGLYSFATHIEPDFHRRMIRKYGVAEILKLVKKTAANT